jgi:hypothetical protein
MYCEMALFYFLQGKRLDEAWDDLCKRFGYHQDITYSMEFFGSEGQAKMNNLMDTLHNNPFIEINGLKVVKVDDIEKLFDENLLRIKDAPKDLPIIGITGGEPTLLDDKLFVLIQSIRENLPNTKMITANMNVIIAIAFDQFLIVSLPRMI